MKDWLSIFVALVVGWAMVITVAVYVNTKNIDTLDHNINECAHTLGSFHGLEVGIEEAHK